MRYIYAFLRNERGSQGIEASGAALAAAIVVAALLGGAALVGSKADRAYQCAAAVLGGGGGGCGGGSAASSGDARPAAFAQMAGFVRGASDGAIEMTNAVFTTFGDGGNLVGGDPQTTARYQQAVFSFAEAPVAQLAQLVQPTQHQTEQQGPDPNATPQEAAGGTEAGPQEAAGRAAQTGPITHDDGMQVLQDNNIGIQSSSGRIGPRCRTCTSLEGMQRETIDGLAQFTRDFRANTNCADCTVTVTGGTEDGHSTRGNQTHRNGYKVDIRFTPEVDRYIMNFERAGTRSSDGAALYRDPNGTVYARESDHWDIVFAQ